MTTKIPAISSFRAAWLDQRPGPNIMGNRFFSRSTFRGHLYLLTTMMLVPAFVGIYWLSFWLRFERQLGGENLACFTATVGWIVAVKLGWFAGLRACRGWSRSVTFYDLMVLLRAATGGLMTMMMIQYLVTPLPTIPRSVFLLDWGTTVVVLGGVRSLMRGVREMRWSLFSPPDQVRVLIAGVGDMGVSTLRMIRRLGQPRYRVVGFLGGTSSPCGNPPRRPSGDRRLRTGRPGGRALRGAANPGRAGRS